VQHVEEGLQVGETLGPYRLEAILGEGGMGIVYLAADADGGRVALKVLKQKLAGDATYVARFRREARVAAEVQHAHLVPILDSGELDDRHFLASAYVPGGSLRERLPEHGPLAIVDAVRLTAQVAAGLDALHAKGLIHRDVKPANILDITVDEPALMCSLQGGGELTGDPAGTLGSERPRCQQDAEIVALDVTHRQDLSNRKGESPCASSH
jgi:serine/threonine kinase PknH